MSEQIAECGDWAFPQTPNGRVMPGVTAGGLTIRDWFASSGAAAEYAKNCGDYRTVGEMNKLLGETHTQAQCFAFWCYEYADAMLAARKAGA